MVQTGAWMVADDRPLPGELEAFLDAGEPPLYFGFGSMRVRYFGPRALVENDEFRSSSTTLVNAEIGYDFNETWSLTGQVFNMLDSSDNDIEYYYASRLPGEPPEGVDDRHIHPTDPISGRLVLKVRF